MGHTIGCKGDTCSQEEGGTERAEHRLVQPQLGMCPLGHPAAHVCELLRKRPRGLILKLQVNFSEEANLQIWDLHMTRVNCPVTYLTPSY